MTQDPSSHIHDAVRGASKSLDTTDDVAETKTKTEDDTNMWVCDGQCSHSPENWLGFYSCDVCPGVSFCDPCIDAIKSNKLGFRICNPDHIFWQVYPFDQKLLDVATEKADRRIVPRASWLKRIREAWEE